MIDGEAFSMRQHGFARNKQFSIVGASASECVFRLASDDETQAQRQAWRRIIGRQRQHQIRDRDLPAGSERTIRLILCW
jgi:hypothetical protein